MQGGGVQQPTGEELHGLCRRLYPINRSITGQGVRASLALLREFIDLRIHEVPSGTPVFDWVVPPEWNVTAAHITDGGGRRVVDLADHSLHLVGYSEPVRRRMSLEELQPHLHSLPDHPDWIPYRTSYYARNWGFCLQHARRLALAPGDYDVVIDATLEPGSLTFAECVIPGETDREILVTTHVCHPSLANDNLSGIAVATHLARQLAAGPRPVHTLRFLFIPGTIGAITWLALNQDSLARIAGGIVLSGIGDPGPLTYKQTRLGCAPVDRVFARVLGRRGAPHHLEPFSPYGYDERQFNSPGINLPVGCLMRTPFGQYAAYHTSGDNLDLLSPDSLADALAVCREALGELDLVRTFVNLSPHCEPQLGRRGLYDDTGGENDRKAAQMALLWMLSYSDGTHSTLDISELSGLPLATLDRAARRLAAVDLLAGR